MLAKMVTSLVIVVLVVACGSGGSRQLRQAEGCFAKGRYNCAVERCRRALMTDPQTPFCLQNLPTAVQQTEVQALARADRELEERDYSDAASVVEKARRIIEEDYNAIAGQYPELQPHDTGRLTAKLAEIREAGVPYYLERGNELLPRIEGAVERDDDAIFRAWQAFSGCLDLEPDNAECRDGRERVRAFSPPID